MGKSAPPMQTPGSRIVKRIGLLLACWLSATTTVANALEIRPLDETEKARIELAGRLYNTGERAHSMRILDSLRVQARAHGDSALAWRTRAATAGLLAWGGESREAESLLRPILPIVSASTDTALFLGASVWFGKALLDQTRFGEAESVYRSIVPIAARARSASSEGWARMGLAYITLAQGSVHEARENYEAAGRLLRQAGNRYGEIEALVGQGRVYQGTGETDRARACFAEACARAHEYGLLRNEAIARNDLGVEEYARGDPAAALRSFRAAWRIGQAAGDRWETSIPASNVAGVLAEMGRFDEASSVLDSLIAACHAGGYTDHEGATLLVLGKLWTSAGKPRRAEETYRRVLDLGAELPVVRRLGAYQGLADLRAREGDFAGALGILETDVCLRLRNLARADHGLEYDALRSRLLVEVGRRAAAIKLAEASAIEADRIHRGDMVVSLLTTAARARLEEGDHRSALAHLVRATDAWEALRSRPSDPEWRELWANGQSLTSLLIQALLTDPDRPSDDARLRAAFAAVQRFKARGLAERIQGTPAPPVPAPSISLEEVQREILHPKEVLLDAFVGPDTSFVFVVTRDRCELIPLPGEKELTMKVQDMIRLFSGSVGEDGAERTELIREVSGRLSQFFLGSSRKLIADSEQVLLAPDGMLHLLPLEVLRVDDSGAKDDDWLGNRRVVARIPSISLLAQLRRAAAGRVDEGSGLVMYGVSNGGSQELTGARAEAMDLQGRFRGFRLLREGIDSLQAASTEWLGGYEILHFAAHTELNSSYPWRSGILLRSDDVREGSRLLSAERIAASRLQARLVVISGCESAGGRVIRGEAIQGLSTAFLAAGARAVVATLWPVDDRASSRFTSLLYDGLESGLGAGDALRCARSRMATSGTGSDPSTWAGFVLIGDPDSSVHLRARPRRLRGIASGLILAVPVAVLWWALRRHGGKRRGVA
jgi:CHAT domain-containing protein/tetratricopeptide (TPR) repeat protein